MISWTDSLHPHNHFVWTRISAIKREEWVIDYDYDNNIWSAKQINVNLDFFTNVHKENKVCRIKEVWCFLSSEPCSGRETKYTFSLILFLGHAKHLARPTWDYKTPLFNRHLPVPQIHNVEKYMNNKQQLISTDHLGKDFF